MLTFIMSYSIVIDTDGREIIFLKVLNRFLHALHRGIVENGVAVAVDLFDVDPCELKLT